MIPSNNKVTTATFIIVAVYGLMLFSTSGGNLTSLSLWHWLALPVLGMYVFFVSPAMAKMAQGNNNIFTHFLSGALGGGIPLAFFVMAIGSIHNSSDLVHYIIISAIICFVLGVISVVNRNK